MQRTKYISCNNVLILVICNRGASNAMNFLHTRIALLNKKYLKKITSYWSDEILRSPCHFKHIQCYFVALDSTESEIYNSDTPKINRKPAKNICHVTFDKEAVEMINLPAMFNSTNVKSSLVTKKCNFTTPTVFYDLSAPIHSERFKINSLCRTLMLISFLLILQYYHLIVINLLYWQRSWPHFNVRSKNN